MSRPFSYSDENFTVIGNVLFCHIKITKPIPKTEPIIEIPPEIYARMLFTTLRCSQVFSEIGTYRSNSLSMGVMETDDKKHYFSCNFDINGVDSYVVGYYILKDI